MSKTKFTIIVTMFLFLCLSTARAQTKLTGQWQIVDNVDEMTNKKSTMLILKTEDGKYALIVYQKSRADDDFVVGIQLLDRGLIADDKRPLLRFDEEQAFEQSWMLLQQGKGAAFVIASDKLLSKLLTATTFRIRFEEYLGGITTIKFDVRGLKVVIESLKTRGN